MKNKWHLIDKEGNYLIRLNHATSMTWSTSENALVITGSKEFVKGYCQCIKDLFFEDYFPKLVTHRIKL